MKAQNREEKQAKAQEREKLQREIAARERAERIQAEYEDRLNAMQADNEKKQNDLREALEQVKQKIFLHIRINILLKINFF